MNENKSHGLLPIIAQAIEIMEVQKGHSLSIDELNLAELGRLTGLSRSKLRTLKRKGFTTDDDTNPNKLRKSKLDGFEELINTLMKLGITNSPIILSRLKAEGFKGSITIVKKYIAEHKYLLPAKRILVAPQGSRGNRFTTPPGEAFQMDWGFTRH